MSESTQEPQELDVEFDDEELQTDEDTPEEEGLVQPQLKEYMRRVFDKNGWSSRQFRDKGISHTSMLLILNPHKRVGERLLTKIAKVMNLPLQTVMEWGEVVPSATEGEQQRRLLVHIYESVSEAGKKQIVDFAQFVQDQEA